MRASKQESDLEFWMKTVSYWRDVVESYFLLDDREGEARAEQRLYVAELNWQEAKGEIIVYTGRAKPTFKGVFA